ncbi:beta-L-arabinofuranosidase domain-containing protein [Paenibacillus sp. PL2-23]|uniref:beta-L-arabinofuranosidase domain-containing protein n=1 Tax=Paenibacillus sp. PL2-23 TaxID=2100729 RepID=UPI0030FD0A6F
MGETTRKQLQHFGLDQVRLTEAYHTNAAQKELQYLYSYELDRLLAGFRETKGLEPKAPKYPGWEDTEIRGHTLGHYMTACAQAYAASKDPVMLDRLQYLVAELSQCQLDSGYLSAYPEVLIDNVENRQPAWVPWYTMHKIIAGLISIYHATGSKEAFDVVSRLGDWVASRTSRWTKELQATVLAVEYGGMNDCLYDLYQITGHKRHLDAAHQFDELPLFEAIHAGHDILRGKHANTAIPKFIGALNRYLTLGERERFYLETAERFWEMVVNHHSYMTGGNSESEHFGEPDLLDAKRTDITCETCNSYNMLKLTRELFKLTRDRRYADFYERTYMNAILSSQHPETGMTMYFQPMATGYFKIYSSPFQHFWCCTGTGMESFTKLNDSIYFHDWDALYVTQYIGSILDWSERGLMLAMTADLPANEQVELRVNVANGERRELALHLRVPYWSAGAMGVRVNGESALADNRDGYLVIRRTWADGDIVELTLPMNVMASRLPDNPQAVGFQYGPAVLSAALGSEDMTQAQTGIMVRVPTKRMRMKDYLIPRGMSPEEWIRGVEKHLVKQGSELVFQLRQTDEDDRLLFTPHYRQHTERYGIYWHVIAEDSEELERHKRQARMEELIREATIDSVQVGNDQYELQHEIQGENTFGGAWDGQNGRAAHPGGWFSYKLRVLPGEQNSLQFLFFAVHHDRVLNIYADGELLASYKSDPQCKREFLPVTLDIPASITKDKEWLTFTFVPEERINGIYGILRTMKPIEAN